jgi:hypothetical protein
MREQAYKLIHCLIDTQPRTRLLSFSKRGGGLLLREKLLGQVLDVYVASMTVSASGSSVSLVNQSADDVLEALVLKSDIRFLVQSVAPLLSREQPPLL